MVFSLQIQLLEEEEKEKREEEERKERRKTKDREKKLRRKERLKGKDKEIERKGVEVGQTSTVTEISLERSSPDSKEELSNNINSEDSLSELGDIMLDRPLSPDNQEEQYSNLSITSELQNDEVDTEHLSAYVADTKHHAREDNGLFVTEQSKSAPCKLRYRKDHQFESANKWYNRSRSMVDDESGDFVDDFEPKTSRCNNGVNKQSRSNLKSDGRNFGRKYGEKFHCSNYRVRDRYDFKACGCNLQNDYRTKDAHNSSLALSERETKAKTESSSDISVPSYRKSKYTNGVYLPDSCRTPKNKIVTGKFRSNREFVHTKKVWYPRSSSDSDITLRSSTSKVIGCEEARNDGIAGEHSDNILKSPGDQSSDKVSITSNDICDKSDHHQNQEEIHENMERVSTNISSVVDNNGCHTGSASGAESPNNSLRGTSGSPTSSNSNSDSCSSCLTEGDDSAIYSLTQNTESVVSDSENGPQHSEGRDTPTTHYREAPKCSSGGEWRSVASNIASGIQDVSCITLGNFQGDVLQRNVPTCDNDRILDNASSQVPHCLLPAMHSQGISFPVFPAPSTMAYYHQRPTSWSGASPNGLVSFPQPSCFILPSPLGYGLTENRPSHFCMQYSAMQPVINVLDLGQLPAYQVVNKANGVNLLDQTKNVHLGESRESVSVHGPVPNCQGPLLGQNANSAASNKDGNDFSLFHFGGPISVTIGDDLNSGNLKEGFVGDTFSNSSVIPSRVEFECSGKEVTTGDEYSLFGASNRTRFSFF